MKKLLLFLALAAAGLQGWADDFYIVGNATNDGWKASGRSNAYKMTKDPSLNKYTWTGFLKSTDGDLFKICIGPSTWEAWCAGSGDKEITISIGETETFTDDGVKKNAHDGNGWNTDDNKWKVKVTGYYTLTLDLDANPKTLTANLLVPADDKDNCSISTSAHLENFATLVNTNGMTSLNAKLTADIDMSEVTHTSIGTSSNKYAGTFDGQGHIIENLSLSASSGSGVGFFGYTNGATIQDVEFLKANVNVTGGNNTGIVVGICDGGTTIQRCAVVNSYISGWDHTGSIAGCAKGNSTITNCYSNAKVKSVTQAGGLVGTSEGMTLDHCIFMGPSIEGTYSSHGGARGLISLLEGGTTTMQHNVVAAQYVYSGGGSSYCQSLVSQNGKTLTVDDNYSWSTTRYGNASSNQTYGLNSNDVNGYQKAPGEIDKTFFEGRGFDFTDDWKMVEGLTYAGGSYPILKWMTAPAASVEISTPQELYDFSTFMWDNQDVTLADDITYTATSYQGQDAMIGTDFRKYAGTFDGNNHTVTVDFNNTVAENTGLFCQVNGGTIKNLKVAGDITTNKKFAGGICAVINRKATITNCESNVTITDSRTEDKDGTHGGIVALVQSHGEGVEISNCLFSGAIESEYCDGCGGVVGWTSGGENNVTIKNCLITGTMNVRTSGNGKNDIIARDGANESNNYYVGTFTGISNNESAISATADQKTSGALCYLLNGSSQGGTNWTQTIGTDTSPVPFNTRRLVYFNDPGYANMHIVNSVYQISNANELVNFSALVNAGPANLAAVLTTDIDMTGKGGAYTPIGTNDHRYAGTFDGQKHSIKNLVIDTGNSNIGLFGYLANGATIKNLIIDSTCSFRGLTKVGGIAGYARGGGTVTLTNVINMANVACTGGSTGNEGNAAGLIACVTDNTILIAKNCANTGTVGGQNGQCAAFAGWTQVGTTFTNCWNSGTIYNYEGTAILYRNSGCVTQTNCYHVTDADFTPEFGTKIGTSALASGELCYKLNGSQNEINWYQNLSGTADAIPVPFSTHSQVYANGDLNCNGSPKDGVTYSNTQDENRDSHSFENGICTNCNGVDLNYLSPVNDFYEIDNIYKLNWFAHYVNEEGKREVNAKLTGDITQGSVTYTPIGSRSNPYMGHFDGNNHSVTLSLNNGSYSYQGLFGVVTDGVFIEKVIVKGYVTGNNYVGGIVGGTNGGSCNAKETNIWNCGNEATITANGANGAGIIGANISGSASIILLNCYNTGAVNSGSDGGAMSGWLGGGWSNVRNCYNSAAIMNNGSASKAFGRNNGCFFNNCFYTESSDTDNTTEDTSNGRPTEIADDAVASGQLCWNLGSDNFTQDLSAANHPTFGSKEVHAGKWFNVDDYDTFYNEEGSSRTSYVLNLDETKTIFSLDPNFTLTAKNVNVARNIPANQWIGLCLPFDYDIPSGWKVRELTSVNGSGEDASMKFSSALTIEAGKPYIVKPTETVTNFTATDKEIVAESTDVTYGDVTMVGNLNQTSIARGSFYINTSSQLKKLTAESATLKGFRAYFTVDGGSGVKALAFAFDDDDATGISNLNVNENLNEAIYNISGQRLSKAQKGINIINGKKILK